MKLKKFEGNPILSPLDSNDWESLVTCNPGVVYDNGTFYMLYRAAGNDAEHVISLGLATSKDGFHFERVSDVPVFGPSEDGPDSGCVEDPRIRSITSLMPIVRMHRGNIGTSAMMKCCCRIAVVMLLWLSVKIWAIRGWLLLLISVSLRDWDV